MPYLIQTADKPDHEEVRASARSAHLDYLEAHKNEILAAGAMLKDDGSGGYGGVYIIDVEDRMSAEGFIAADPFTKAGLFESVRSSRWRKAYLNYENHL